VDVAVFSTKPYDKVFLNASNTGFGHKLQFYESRLTHETTPVAAGYSAVCVFVNDILDAQVIEDLAANGTKLVALRCAGFNNVDLVAAARHVCSGRTHRRDDALAQSPRIPRL
jgi:D-lactate dehydrogenase